METWERESNLNILAGIWHPAENHFPQSQLFKSVNNNRRNYPKVALITDKGLVWFFEIITKAKGESASNHHGREPLQFWEVQLWPQPTTVQLHLLSLISLWIGVRNAESQAAVNYWKPDFYQNVGGLFWRSLSNIPPRTRPSCSELTKLCPILYHIFVSLHIPQRAFPHYRQPHPVIFGKQTSTIVS